MGGRESETPPATPPSMPGRSPQPGGLPANPVGSCVPESPRPCASSCGGREMKGLCFPSDHDYQTLGILCVPILVVHPLEPHIWPLRVGSPVIHSARSTIALGLWDPRRPPEDQVRTAGSRNGDPSLPRLLAPAAGVQRALCAQLLTELGESCKRLPSQTPPRTGPQPPSLRPPSTAGVVLAFTAAPMKF